MGKVLSLLLPPPFNLLLKAAKKRKEFQKVNEKDSESEEDSKSDGPRPIRFRRLSNGFKRYFLAPFFPCCLHKYQPQHIPISRETTGKEILKRIFTDKTLENKLLKAVLGFIFGIIFGLMFFVFLSSMMRVTVAKAFVSCAIVGCVTAFGLAFSNNFRCVAFLIFPELFSTRGRTILLAGAYIIVISGPFINMTNNFDILAKSVSCQMESIKNKTKDDLKESFSPIIKHMDAVKKTLDAVVKFSKIVREAFRAFAELIIEILEGVKRVYRWFAKILRVCPKLMGAPEEYCYNMLSEKEMKCYEIMFILGFLCLLVRGFAAIVCPLLGIAKLACQKLQDFKEDVIEPLEKRIDEYCNKIYDDFYVNITTYNFYDYRTHESQTASEIKNAIMKEIDEKTYGVLIVFRYVSLLAFVGLAFLICRALIYRYKYLHRDRYDNIYLTWDIQDMDGERVKQGEESIFPMSFVQRRSYIKPWSLKLTKGERIRAIFSFTIFIMGSLQIASYLFLDHILYWLIDVINYHGRVDFKVPRTFLTEIQIRDNSSVFRPNSTVSTLSLVPYNVELKVQGTSYLADMYQDMVNVFNPILKHVPQIDTRNCMPNANPPDYDTYEVIGVLLLLCLLLSVTEVYGLRLRHAICGCYYPKRKKERAEWLYYHILSTKGNYLTRIRRLIRLKYKDWERKNITGDLTVLDYVLQKVKCLKTVFGWFGYQKTLCLACSSRVQSDGSDDCVSCPRPFCHAIYCRDCFEGLNNQCTACMSPLEYGDYSDISEVVDSSEDDLIEAAIEQGKRHAQFIHSKIKKSPHDANTDGISADSVTET